MLIDSSDLDVEGNIINASTASLRDNRHYDLEVMASNALGSQSSYAETEISELFLICGACPSLYWAIPTC